LAARGAAAPPAALLDRDVKRLAALMDANFDLRRTIYALPSWQLQMIEVARACGASAKFAGSGGAILGICTDEAMFDALRTRLGEIGTHVVRPRVVE
jgi:glucuronokinase